MPYFYDPNLDQQNQQSQTQNGSSVNISGASPTYNSQGSPQAGQTQGQNQPLKTGSGFENLDNYLKVNNAQDFGQKFQGKVSDQITNAQSQMNQAGDQFKNQVQSANYTPSTSEVNSAIANPTSANAQDFQKWEKQSYSGPKDISETQDLWNKYWSGVNQAQTNTKLLGTEPGRFTLLNQYFGRPSYNYGEKSLDNLLYQESGLGNQTKALQDQAAQLQTQGQTQASSLRNVASQRAGDVESNAQNVRNSIGIDTNGNVLTGDKAGAIGKQYQSIDQGLQAENAFRNQLQNDLQTRNLSPDEMQRLGLSEGQSLYNVDPNNYFKTDLTKSQYMTPEQQSYIQALSQLAGINDTYAQGDLDPSGAIDSSGLQKALGSSQQDYQNAITQDRVFDRSAALGFNNIDPGQLISIDEAQRQIEQMKQPGAVYGYDQDQFVANMQKAVDEAKLSLAQKYGANNVIGGKSTSLQPALNSGYTGPTLYSR